MRWALLTGLALLLVASPSAHAASSTVVVQRRLALLVSHPSGGPTTATLRYAERDAMKMARVLTELGGFAPEDVVLLASPTADELVVAMQHMERRVVAARAEGAMPILLFYYSGHAVADALQLGTSRLPLSELKRALSTSHAEIRIAFLDACQSGAITRLKGGRRGPSFVVDVSPGRRTRGSVFISSSSAEEASQESDELRGSFFTHHLVSGLRGAADRSGDATVSLNEAYAYAYNQTVTHTAGTRGGTQHPTYTYDLRGNGTLQLTRLGGRGALLFAEEGEGTYLVYDRGRDVVVGEVRKAKGEARRISVAPGRYVVKKRGRAHLLLQDIEVVEAQHRVVSEAAFRRVPFEDDVTKGPGWFAARRAVERRWLMTGQMGYQAFFDAPSRGALFHPSPLMGARMEWVNGLAPGLSLQFDSAFGGTRAEVVQGYYQEAVDVDFRLVVGGVGLSYDHWWQDLRLQVGPRLSAVYARRTFVQAALPAQDLFTVSPGVSVGASWDLGGLVVGFEARAHYLHYATEAEDRSLGFGESYLTLGYAL